MVRRDFDAESSKTRGWNANFEAYHIGEHDFDDKDNDDSIYLLKSARYSCWRGLYAGQTENLSKKAT